MSYDPNGEYWRARAEIAEAELAEVHKGFKETCAAMVRNAKERDEWKDRYESAAEDIERKESEIAIQSDNSDRWRGEYRKAEAARAQALQWFNDATSGLMSVAAESNRYRLAWQSARERAQRYAETLDIVTDPDAMAAIAEAERESAE